MKRNTFLLIFMGVTSLSLVSCNEVDTKIDNATGNKMVSKAFNKTTEKLSNLTKEKFVGFDLKGYLKGDIDIDYQTLLNEAESENIAVLNDKIDLNLNTSLHLQGNVDLEKIKQEKPDISTLEIYSDAKLDYDYSYLQTKGSEKIESDNQNKSLESKQYQKGNKIVYYTQNNDEKQYDMSTIETETFVNNISKYLDILSNNNNESLTDNILNNLGIDSYYKVLFEKTCDFFYGKITSESYLKVIDETLFENKLLESNKGKILKEPIINVLDISYEINPIKYLDYTIMDDVDNVTLSSTLDYERWSKDLNNSFNKKIESFNKISPTYNILVGLRDFVVSSLPNDLRFDFTLNLDKDGYLSKLDFNLKTNGTFAISNISKLVGDSIFDIENLLSNSVLNYDVKLNGGLDFDIKNNAITVTTLTVPKSE